MKTYEIGLEISSQSQDAALKETQQQLDAVAARQKAAAGAASAHQNAASKLAATIKGELAAALGTITASLGFLRFLEQGTEAAIKNERSLRQLAGMATQFGQDGAKAAAAAQELGDALQQVGYDDDEVIASVRELLPLTRDYQQAVSAVSLAYDINAKTGKGVGEVMSILQPLIAGQERGLIRAMKELGVSSTTTQGALAELDKTFRGSAAGLDDTMTKLATAKAELDDFGKLLGGPISQAMVWLIEKLKQIGQYVGAVALGWYQFGRAGATAFQTIWDAVRGKVSVEDIKARFAELRATFEAEWDAWGESVEKTGPEAKKQPAIKGRTKADDAAAKTSEEARLKALDAARLRTFEREMRRVDAEVAKKRYAQQLIQQGMAETEALAEANRMATFDRMNAERDEVVNLETLKRQESRATAEMAAINAESTRIANLNAASSIAGSLGVLFGQSKAAALAQAVIGAYAAASGSARDTPGPVWVRIAAYFAALAQVWQAVEGIRGTDMGSSGGGPGGGGAAAAPPTQVTMGGGVAATAPPIQVSRGAGVAATAPATPTTNIHQTTTQKQGDTYVSVQALTASQAAQAMKEISKVLPSGERAVKRQLTSSERTKVGSIRARTT